MSAKVEGRAEELLKDKNFCNVATLRQDGSVHSVPVWVDLRTVARSEHRRGSRVAAQSGARPERNADDAEPREPLRVSMIRGNVAERTHEGADEHIDALAKKYMDTEKYP